MRIIKQYASILVASLLIVAQYILTFFVYKMPGIPALHWVGWGIWLISLIFGIAPIFILGHKGGVPKNKSYVHTTKIVDTSLYAIVRHPQYLAGILFSLSLMLLCQHWLVFLLGIVASVLIWWDIQVADREGIEKFGSEYQQYMQRVPQVNFLLGIIRFVSYRRLNRSSGNS